MDSNPYAAKKHRILKIHYLTGSGARIRWKQKIKLQYWLSRQRVTWAKLSGFIRGVGFIAYTQPAKLSIFGNDDSYAIL